MKFSFIYFLFLFYLQTSFASPLIVAHRAGTADFPENTRHAIDRSLLNEANIIWVTVQLSKDGIPVLYRPKNLNELTDGSGPVSEHSLAELQLLDAAHYFQQDEDYIYRGRSVKIPSLHQILLSYPQVKFIIDIKSPDADPEIMANAIIELRNNIQSPERLFSLLLNKNILMHFLNILINSNHVIKPVRFWLMPLWLINALWPKIGEIHSPIAKTNIMLLN